jgi:hypothetical protein
MSLASVIAASRRRLTPAQRYRAEVLSDEPSVYYRLWEESGTTATDETGTNNATFIGSPVLGVTGPIANSRATRFTNIAHVAQSPTINAFNATSFTVTAWIRRIGSSVNGRVLNRRFTASNNGIILAHNASGTRIRFTLGSGSALNTITDATDISDETWTHFAATYDGTSARLYRNGQLVAGPTAMGYSPETGADLFVGKDLTNVTTGTPFNGDISEAAFFPVALSAARIAAHYDAASIT